MKGVIFYTIDSISTEVYLGLSKKILLFAARALNTTADLENCVLMYMHAHRACAAGSHVLRASPCTCASCALHNVEDTGLTMFL